MSNDDDAEATRRVYCPFFPFSIKGKHPNALPDPSPSTRSVHLNPLWPLSPKLTFVVLVALVASSKASIQPKCRHAHEARTFKRFSPSMLRSRGRRVRCHSEIGLTQCGVPFRLIDSVPAASSFSLALSLPFVLWVCRVGIRWSSPIKR